MKREIIFAAAVANLAAVCLLCKKSKKVSELEKENDKLALENSEILECARTDELTGLSNRYALREDFNEYRGKSVVVALLDIDSFKAINDNYGHDAGDEVLKEVASELQLFFGKENAYRYGGDEMLVIVETENPDHILNTLENIDIILEYSSVEGFDGPINISFGAVYGEVNFRDDLRRLIHKADESLYDAKAQKQEVENGK